MAAASAKLIFICSLAAAGTLNVWLAAYEWPALPFFTVATGLPHLRLCSPLERSGYIRCRYGHVAGAGRIRAPSWPLPTLRSDAMVGGSPDPHHRDIVAASLACAGTMGLAACVLVAGDCRVVAGYRGAGGGVQLDSPVQRRHPELGCRWSTTDDSAVDYACCSGIRSRPALG